MQTLLEADGMARVVGVLSCVGRPVMTEIEGEGVGAGGTDRIGELSGLEFLEELAVFHGIFRWSRRIFMANQSKLSAILVALFFFDSTATMGCCWCCCCSSSGAAPEAARR